MHQKQTESVIFVLCLVLNAFHVNAEKTYYDNDNVGDNVNEMIKWKAPYGRPKSNEDYLVTTPGCAIPDFSKSILYREPPLWGSTCNNRIVFITKTAEYEITFHIDYNVIKMKNRRRLKCCYEFAIRSRKPGFEDSKLMYSRCKRFSHGDTIQQEEEIIVVSCQLRSKEFNDTVIFSYNDAYLILKKRSAQLIEEEKKDMWNVLLMQMDGMSRTRAHKSLGGIIQYMRQHKWLDYRGYQKIDYDSFPNIMSVLTGKHESTIYRDCARGMEHCKDLLIWSKYRNAGYMTAFGEDTANSIFSPFQGFTFPPTDHYARPYILVDEYSKGNVVCSRTKPTALRLLNYFKKFTESYQNDSFFGYLRMSTYSKDPINLPRLSETMLLYFFEHLRVGGILKNTFVFFFSDHGINYSLNRVTGASYYESRLPMLFIWVPHKFRKYYREEYYNMQVNQYRLTTPHDLHATLWKILKMSEISTEIVPSEGCPRCEGFFEDISPDRTCDEVNVDETWCTCHDMIDTKNVIESRRSLEAAVNDIQKRVLNVKTTTCTKCELLELKTMLKSEWYIRANKTYYVVAFTVTPFDLAFESVIENTNNEFNVLESYTLTTFNNRSDCVLYKESDRAFCVCVQYC